MPEKSLGSGIGKIWYQKKVSELVSVNLVPEKSTGIGIKNFWYRKKVSVLVFLKILGTVTHCPTYQNISSRSVLKYKCNRKQLTKLLQRNTIHKAHKAHAAYFTISHFEAYPSSHLLHFFLHFDASLITSSERRRGKRLT